MRAAQDAGTGEDESASRVAVGDPVEVPDAAADPQTGSEAQTEVGAGERSQV